jgi:hypothetical protein
MPAIACEMVHLRNDQVSIVQGNGIDLDEAVMISQLGDFCIFVEFQALETILTFDGPLRG